MTRVHALGIGLVVLLAATAMACGESDDDSDGGSGTGGSAGAAGSGGGTGGTGGGEAGTGGGTSGSAGAGGTAGSAGTGGGSNGTCADACANLASAHCPQEDDEATCTADCLSSQEEMTGCEAEFAAFAGCIATAQVTCDAEEHAQFAGCDSEETAYFGCTACASETSDDACDTCRKQKCCSEARALNTDPDLDAYLDCAMSCTDEACVNGCTATYPTAASAFDAYNQCQDSKCSTECL